MGVLSGWTCCADRRLKDQVLRRCTYVGLVHVISPYGNREQAYISIKYVGSQCGHRPCISGIEPAGLPRAPSASVVAVRLEICIPIDTAEPTRARRLRSARDPAPSPRRDISPADTSHLVPGRGPSSGSRSIPDRVPVREESGGMALVAAGPALASFVAWPRGLSFSPCV